MTKKIIALFIPALFVVTIVAGQQHNAVRTNPPVTSNVVDTNDIVRTVDVQPSFPGSNNAFRQYLSRNLAYPATAVEDGIEGRVVVEFVVCEDGRLCNERIVKGIGGGCDQEALRVIRKMPAWKPAMKDGKP